MPVHNNYMYHAYETQVTRVLSQNGVNVVAASGLDDSDVVPVDHRGHDVPAQSGVSMAKAIVMDDSEVVGDPRDFVAHFASAAWSGDLSYQC